MNHDARIDKLRPMISPDAKALQRWQTLVAAPVTVIGLIAVLLLMASAPVYPGQDDIAPLEQRVMTYWDAISAFDLATAYGLERDALNGDLTAAKFRRSWNRTDWELKSFSIDSIDVDEATAKVRLKLVFDVPELPKDIVRHYTDTWILLDGRWYRDSGDISG
jgi:hypothetical protein